MDRNAALIGGVLLAVGIGGGGYLLYRYKQQTSTTGLVSASQVAVTPLPLPAARTLATVTVSWQNPTGAAAAYGVQAAWLEQASTTPPSGVVSGHLFTSAALAQQAIANPNGAGVLVTTAADRVAQTNVAAGASGSVALFGYFDPSVAVGPFALVAWIVPNPTPGALLASDPVGMKVSQLPSAGRYISQLLATA